MDLNSQSKSINSVNKYRIIIFCFLAFFSISLFLGFQKSMQFGYNSNFVSDIKKNTINDYITYSINGNSKNDILMKDVKFIPLNKADYMNISIKLDSKYNENNVVVLMQEFCTIEAYVDNKKIYSYGDSSYKNSEGIGGGYFKIPISEEYLNKNLDIRLKATGTNYVSGLESISIENKDSMVNSFIMKNIVVIIASVPLFVFGAIIFILSLYKIVLKSDARQLCWVSLCYILLSIWALAHFKILQIYSNNVKFISSLEYICLYFSGIPCILFFYEYAKKKIEKILFNIYLLSYVLFNMLVVILSYINMINFTDALWIYHIFMLLGGSILIAFILKKRKYVAEEMDILYVLTMTFGIGILMLEIIRFYLYAIFKYEILSYNLIPLAIISFIATMIYRYVIGIIKKFYNSNEQDELIDLAFKDQLTQIPNRTKCEEYMRTLSGKINDSYTIINFDLNNLKYINDNFGHHIGDEMIFSGAQIIKDTFSLYGQIGRMGGDEFIAIITITEKKEIEKLLNEMNEKIDEFNKNNDKKYTISIAYGYSIKEKNSADSIWLVYEEADKIMYDIKKKQKEKLNIKSR